VSSEGRRGLPECICLFSSGLSKLILSVSRSHRTKATKQRRPCLRQQNLRNSRHRSSYRTDPRPSGPGCFSSFLQPQLPSRLLPSPAPRSLLLQLRGSHRHQRSKAEGGAVRGLREEGGAGACAGVQEGEGAGDGTFSVTDRKCLSRSRRWYSTTIVRVYLSLFFLPLSSPARRCSPLQRLPSSRTRPPERQ
jgi:hypothetical protein